MALSELNGVIVNTELSWLIVPNPAKLPSESTLKVNPALALSESVAVRVIVVVAPSVESAIAPVGSIVY